MKLHSAMQWMPAGADPIPVGAMFVSWVRRVPSGGRVGLRGAAMIPVIGDGSMKFRRSVRHAEAMAMTGFGNE